MPQKQQVWTEPLQRSLVSLYSFQEDLRISPAVPLRLYNPFQCSNAGSGCCPEALAGLGMVARTSKDVGWTYVLSLF